MQGRKISSGAFANISYETLECYGEHVHFMTATGPISREHRIPVYRKTLGDNPSSNYFAILDNRRGHEDEFSYEDMHILGDITLEAGIRRIVSVSVTNESAYLNIIKLTQAVAHLKDIELTSTTTHCMDEAKNFILSNIHGVANKPSQSFRLMNSLSRQ
ncbi:hypothetical protein [Sneathiella sp. HT1-7]|uniref:hypothetical protein n=1 Tax=Sneathiella sp. HT1-7 TaxID=2887192 RepID=UPI001D1561A5|nr:hypothetical protein [Sneathiella sp. HT1-7]MCC3305490.1 hypothetical protein [Sneathiella sp. HT1-7]